MHRDTRRLTDANSVSFEDVPAANGHWMHTCPASPEFLTRKVPSASQQGERADDQAGEQNGLVAAGI
jgi:hypothetical protein